MTLHIQFFEASQIYSPASNKNWKKLLTDPSAHSRYFDLASMKYDIPLDKSQIFLFVVFNPGECAPCPIKSYLEETNTKWLETKVSGGPFGTLAVYSLQQRGIPGKLGNIQ